MSCGMKFHKKGKESVPCMTHPEACMVKVEPHVCKQTSTCGICGHCLDHCLGHLGIKEDLQFANHVPVNVISPPKLLVA